MSEEEFEWQKACEAENNFQKAVEMVTSIFSPNRRKIDNSWPNGCFFILPKKMNPAKISIPDCTLDTPVKKSSGKISFCLLPCLHNNERLQIKLATRFKIFSHQRSAASSNEDSFSLGITLPDESKKFFKDLEKHLNALAKKKETRG